MLRRLRADEAALFKALRLRALADSPTAFAHTLAETSAKPDSYWEEMTRSMTEPGRHVMFVAEEAGAAVGMAFGILRDAPPPHLGGMWVDPAARSLGVGRALVDATLAWARERGFGDIVLWVTEGNAPALGLYERMGFARTGRSDRLPSDARLTIVEMGRTL